MILPEWVFWFALVAMVIGWLGVILPVIPGVGFIWFTALVYAIAERFATIDPLTFIVLTLLTGISLSADLWMSQIGARAGGASPKSMGIGLLGGLIGAAVGFFFLGIGAVPGTIIGALAGVIIAEWREREDWKEAFKVGSGWLAGCALSRVLQLVIATLMILLFTWQVWRG